MKEYPTDKIRNIALLAHGGTGKTSLIETVLFNCKHTNRLGNIESGTTICDYSAEEIKRQTTIRAKVAPCEWKGVKINMIDTPGFADFSGDLLTGLYAADVAVILICAASGIQVGTEKVYKHAERLGKPRVLFVNKIDRENVEFEALLEKLTKKYGTGVTPITVPLGSGAGVKGVIDVIKKKAYVGASNDGKFSEEEIPEENRAWIDSINEKLVESVVETDEALMGKYLDGGSLSPEEIASTMKSGIQKGAVIPLVCGSATKNMGVVQFLDLIMDYLPDPSMCGDVSAKQDSQEVILKPQDSEKLSAYVFKVVSEQNLGELAFFRVYSGTLGSGSEVHNSSKRTSERVGQLVCMRGKSREDLPKLHAGDIGAVAKLKVTGMGDTLVSVKKGPVINPVKLPHSVISIALKPGTKKDQEKMGEALGRICAEDPTLRITQDVEFNQTVLSGLGETHLEVAVEKLRDKYGISVNTEKTRVPYRETISIPAKAQGKYKKQTGGRGQYGDCYLAIEPNKDDEFEFVNKISGGVIPSKYIPAVEKGIKGAMVSGIIAGYPVINIRVKCYDGSYHSVDSSDMAFQIAGSMGFKSAMEKAKPVLLEPVMNVEVVVPDEYLGDITGDISSRRGRVQGMDPGEGTQTIKAQVPMAEMDRYSTDLKAMTQGKGDYSMGFSHYETITGKLADNVKEEAQRLREQKEKEKASA